MVLGVEGRPQAGIECLAASRLVHVFQHSTTGQLRQYDRHTFSNMALESLKSCSMASTSASLGVLVRKRPVILCMRCILRGCSDCVQRELEKERPVEPENG